MYEKTKLGEAKYFYSQMSANFNDREKFTYNLSAFLSSARSVLQYALEEAKSKNGGQVWYDRRVSASNILSFFKDKRDLNIHYEPVHPIQNVSASITEKIGISDSISVVLRDANGNIISQSSTEAPQHKAKSQTTEEPSGFTVRYLFSDWTGSEDIMTLCQKYIDELENFVKDGVEQGFLTG